MNSESMTLFSPQLAARLDALVKKYPVKRSALVPMLLYAQDEVGYLSDAVIAEVAERICITELDVRNVATYYSMLRFKPVGKYNAPTSVACCEAPTIFLTASRKSWELGTKASPKTASSRLKRWNVLARVAGLLPFRSTTPSMTI
jgi:NADH:ubiquinone oxidoreductase subunit E